MSLLLLITLTVATSAAQATATAPHWRETADETIWTGRYSNCDNGYYVTLPAGVVSHASKSPAPNHGIVVDPAAPESTQSFSAIGSNRYISVFNEYDAADHGNSIRAILDYYVYIDGTTGKKHTDVLHQESYDLAGLKAKRVRLRFIKSSAPVREDKIVAYRSKGGIVYGLTLMTPENTYVEDEKLFEKIVDGFQLSKLPIGECSNN